MNCLIRAKINKIVNLQDIIKTDELNHKSKCEKFYNFSEYFFSVVFLRHIHEGYLSLEYVDDVQSNFVAKLKNLDKEKKNLKNSLFKIT